MHYITYTSCCKYLAKTLMWKRRRLKRVCSTKVPDLEHKLMGYLVLDVGQEQLLRRDKSHSCLYGVPALGNCTFPNWEDMSQTIYKIEIFHVLFRWIKIDEKERIQTPHSLFAWNLFWKRLANLIHSERHWERHSCKFWWMWMDAGV